MAATQASCSLTQGCVAQSVYRVGRQARRELQSSWKGQSVVPSGVTRQKTAAIFHRTARTSPFTTVRRNNLSATCQHDDAVNQSIPGEPRVETSSGGRPEAIPAWNLYSSIGGPLFLLAAEALAEEPASTSSYSKASYYTILGLYIISLPGLYSLIKRTTKRKVVRKTFEVPGPNKSGRPLDATAKEISLYFIRNNYKVKGDPGETITFEGNLEPSRGQAAFLTFCTFVALASTALVCSIWLPALGNYWYFMTVASPSAGWYYWQNAVRKQEVSVKMLTADDDSTTDVIVQGDDEEIDRFSRTLKFPEKGMVYVKGLLER